jgi:hypothetical protein
MSIPALMVVTLAEATESTDKRAGKMRYFILVMGDEAEGSCE